jgi:hypothetical protein
MVYLNAVVEAWFVKARANDGFIVQGRVVSIGYTQLNKRGESGGIR